MKRLLLTLAILLSLTSAVHAADRYWVGGSDSWDGVAGTKWATTSGGVGGAAEPTAADDVYFDANSGAVTVTVGANTRVCRSLDFNGFTGTFTHGAYTIYIGTTSKPASNIAFRASTTMTYNVTSSSAYLIFRSQVTGNTITFNGKLAPTLRFYHTNGEWTFQDAINQSYATAGASIQLYYGTLNTNNVPMNIGYLRTLGTGVGALNLGSSVITVKSHGGYEVSFANPNVVVDPGTSVVNTFYTSGGVVINTGNQSLYDLNIVRGRPIRVQGTFHDVTIGTDPNTTYMGVWLTDDTTITGTLECIGYPDGYPEIRAYTMGDSVTLSVGTLDVDYLQFQGIDAAGTADWDVSGKTVGDLGQNTGITFPASETQYWVCRTSLRYWNTVANWANSSGGLGGTGRQPLGQDDVVFDSNSFDATYRYVYTNTPYPGRNITFAAATNSPSWTNNSGSVYPVYLRGNVTLAAAGMSTGSSYGFTWIGRYGETTFTWTSNGCTLGNSLTIGSPYSGVTFELADNFKMSSVRTLYLQLNGATFDPNDQDISAGFVTMSGSGVVNMGAGTWRTNGIGNQWITQTFTGTLNKDTATIEIVPTASGFVGFNGASGMALPNFIIDDVVGSGYVSIGGTNMSFDSFVIEPDITEVRFPILTTTTFGAFEAGGSGSSTLVISAVPGSTATLSKSSGIVACDYIQLQDITVTGGASWYAGRHSTIGSNVNGWIQGQGAFESSGMMAND